MNISRDISRLAAGISSFMLVALALPLSTFAIDPSTVVVTPTNTQGWSTADTRPGGAVNFVNDSGSPLPTGALQLTTDATITAKAQYLHASNTPIGSVTRLSYSTKQNSALFPQGDPSYQVIVNLNGTTGFTTLVFEPYENTTQGLVAPGIWQSWDVAAGQFWSTRPVTCSNGGVVAGHGGAPFYSLDTIKTMCPGAVVIGFGANIGSNNPSYDVETDAINFNGTTYNFELTNAPIDKDQCKKDGYKNLTDSEGNTFKNQGQCVSSVASVNKPEF